MATKRASLKSLGNVLRELGRVYRMAHNGKIAWQDAAHAARILREVRHLLEASDLEQRLAALEAELGIVRATNGSGRAGRLGDHHHVD